MRTVYNGKIINQFILLRPRVLDWKDGFQLRRVAANILDKQPQTADNGVVLQLRGWAGG
jgi:hypothetical protein